MVLLEFFKSDIYKNNVKKTRHSKRIKKHHANVCTSADIFWTTQKQGTG